jgi:hypothetical protein
MKVPAAVLVVLAAAVLVTSCSGSGTVHAPGTGHGSSARQVRPQAARLDAQPQVGCDQAIQQVGPPGGRILFGVLAVPPAVLPGRGGPTGAVPWRYFWKYGLVIRADSPAVLVTIPGAARHRAAIAWGSVGPASSLRLLSCRQQLGPWKGYAGGFYLTSASGCVPVTFAVGRRSVTLVFAVNRRCSAAT